MVKVGRGILIATLLIDIIQYIFRYIDVKNRYKSDFKFVNIRSELEYNEGEEELQACRYVSTYDILINCYDNFHEYKEDKKYIKKLS